MNVWAKKSIEQVMTTARNSPLKRSLRAIDLASLGIGSIVGVGVFVATGQGVQLAGPAVILSFLIAALTAGLCALIYSELACLFPVSGSVYSYSYVIFGELIAWMIGWTLMATYLIAAGAIASGWSATVVDFLKNIGITLPLFLTSSPLTGGIIDLPAVFLTLLITMVLYRGVAESSFLNRFSVVIKLIVILLFIMLGVSHVDFAHYQPFMPFGWSGVIDGAAIIFFAYLGFDAISTAAEEAINPKRDIPLGLIICLSTVIILYIAVAIVLVGIIPFHQVNMANALPDSLASIGIHWGGALIATGIIVGLIDTLLVTVYGQIRVFMVIARDGLLPESLAHIHPVRQIPARCTILTGIFIALIAGFFPLAFLIDLCNIGTLFVFIVISLGVIVLRYTQPHYERKFRCPGVPYTPLITMGFCLYLMMHLPKFAWHYFAIWLLCGFIVYRGYGLKHSRLQKQLRSDS